VRVLYFTRDYTPHDYRFLTALAGEGMEVYFLRLERGKRQVEDRPLPPEVRQVAWRGGQGPFSWRIAPALLSDLRRILRQVKPDIVHAGPLQTAAFLAALAGPTADDDRAAVGSPAGQHVLGIRFVARCG
jgi:hypothetical protein